MGSGWRVNYSCATLVVAPGVLVLPERSTRVVVSIALLGDAGGREGVTPAVVDGYGDAA
jgi:hypothetical protein